VDLQTKDMDEFLIKCLRKKLKYWFLIHLPLVSKTFIISLVLVFILWFFINVWKGGQKRMSRSVKPCYVTFLWGGGQLTTRTRVQRDDVCAPSLMVGGLGITNLKEALVTSLCKWVMYALELGDSSLRTLFKYMLNYCLPSKHKKRAPNIQQDFVHTFT
jgi:hypothetical protein